MCMFFEFNVGSLANLRVTFLDLSQFSFEPKVLSRLRNHERGEQTINAYLKSIASLDVSY